MNLKPLACVGVLALILGGCGSKRELEYKNVQIKELERQNAELEAQLAAALASQGSGPVAPTDDSGPMDGGKGWSVTGVDKDIQISISNEILFKPGSAVLSDKAKSVLDTVISKIQANYPGAAVRVEGHTDDQPVRRSKDEHKDNWDLSGNRAQAVLHYLESHGIPAAKLGFAGYGMHRPVSSNASASGKALNRRVEILVITNK